MRPFFWKFVLCILPCILAAWVTVDAAIKFNRGDSGGFKLGVDLVGGTILVYEIDLRKTQDADSKERFDPVRDINVLAESLKRRIDPNDIYNITIRPAGGEGRIEIILPTGGTQRTQKAEKNWNNLLEEMKEKFLKNIPKSERDALQVGRGRTLDLADQIQVIQSQTLWKDKLFSSKQGWDRLLKKALDDWAYIDIADGGKYKKELLAIPPGELKKFEDFVITTLDKTSSSVTSKVMKVWLKKRAWEEMMTLGRENQWVVRYRLTDQSFTPGDSQPEASVKVVPKEVLDKLLTLKDKTFSDKEFAKELAGKLTKEELTAYEPQILDLAVWRYLDPFRKEMDRIDPDNVEQLTSFVINHGTVIGQAGLSLIQPLVGKNVTKIFPEGPDVEGVLKFIHEYYGPPAQEIVDKINEFMKDSNQGKDLSVEEVQRIKDLVSKVGSLEFRILANQKDDKQAIEDAEKWIKSRLENQAVAEELKVDAERGLPPPGPRESGKKEPKTYIINTARGTKSKVTYSWVELGPQERKSLRLNNAIRTDSLYNAAWVKAFSQRDFAVQLPEARGDRLQLNGALFYSRKCEDRNIPAEERAKKEVEYFVLTRDPEFVTETSDQRTPKIDGSYLVNATSAPGADLRPAVHFVFNNAGGVLFGNITRKNVTEEIGTETKENRRHLAIILDGMVMSAPTINSEIRTHGQISGEFTSKEVESLVNILRAGRLPATLKPQPVSESTIAATLGQDTIVAGINAISLAFLGVLIFMCIYYRFAGIVASVALLANLLLTVGFMVAVQATFTLSGLAGIVLTLGMAVDANVLIYERLREERERGATLLQAIRNGYDRALPTIIDTHLSSIFTAIVLYVVGNDNLKGFAVTMTVGLVISLFTSLFMTRTLFDFWQMKGWLTKLTMMRLFARPDFDFMSIRYVMFSVTLGLSILGVGLFIGRLPNDLNIDFVGGTAYGGKLSKGVLIETLRDMVDEKHQKEVLSDVTVEMVPHTDGRRYKVSFPKGDKLPRTISLNNIPDGTPEEQVKAVTKRMAKLPDTSVELLFNTTDNKDILEEINKGESRNFTIRTTEKEPEIVQACLDQLLREDGKPLLATVYARAGKLDKREVRVYFYHDDKSRPDAPPTATASPSFFRSLLNRELRRNFKLTQEKESLPFVFEVNGEKESDRDGKFKILKVTFGQELKEEDFLKVKKALEETEQEFAFRPQPDRLENFDSALATETRYRAMWAILASWTAILLYLWFRFGNWTFGLAAVICLIHDLFFTVGIVAACYFLHETIFGTIFLLDDFKFDLPSVAALLTLVGYSVNDTIVVFDRIREVRGKNPDLTPKMINDSINQTLSRTILSSLTVWIVVVVLYFFGGPGVHLFAFVMVVGVLVGTYSSIYIASPLLLMFGEGKHEDPMAQGVKLPTPKPETAPA